ncbi:tetratricopeptide repeat protein [Candidatus Desantisbacteria bacterium]|nr:tetratricopeptide repeat protein [Candidatus Desantisbacteria bacterium]
MNRQSVIFCYLFIICCTFDTSAQDSKSVLDKFVPMDDLQKETTEVLQGNYMMVINYNDLAPDIVLRLEKLDTWLLKKSGSLNRAIREKTRLAADLKQAAIEVEQFLSEKGILEIANGLDTRDYFEAELFLKEDEKGRKNKERAGINYCLGNIKFIQMAFKQAEASYKKASQLDPDNPEYLYMRGRTNEFLGDYIRAIQCFEQVMSIHSKSFPENHPYIAHDLNNLGIAWDNLCRFKKAVKYFEQSLAITYNLPEVDPLDIAGNLNNLAISCFSLGEYEKAILYYQQSLSVFQGILSENDSRITCILNNIALSLCSLERYEDAKKYYQEALEINIRIWGKGGEKHPLVGQSMNNIGLTYYLLKDYSQAIKCYEQGLTILGKSFGQDHPCMIQTINNLGLAWYGFKEYRKAIGYFEQALSINRKILETDNHPDIALSLKYIGLSFYSLGEIEKGKEYLKNSLSIFQHTLGPKHVYTKSTRELLEKL